MIVLPYGHDQSVYGRQWVTAALIAVNVLVFGYTSLADGGAEEQLATSIARVQMLQLIHPDARIDPTVLHGAPEGALSVFGGLVQHDPEAPLTDADVELEDATGEALRALGELPTHRLGYRPGDPSVLAFFTSVFVHGGLWHLLGNMLFLWLAGAVIECFWDRKPYLLLYFLAAAGATLAHHLSAPESMTPVVGASGAIAGLLGAFVIGYPNTRIRVLYALWPLGVGHFYIRAWLLIPLWALLQLLWASTGADDGVAYWAHLGGFAVGVIGAVLMQRMGWVIGDAGDGTTRSGR